MGARSYSSNATRLTTTVGEWFALYKTKRGDAPKRRAQEMIGNAHRFEMEIRQAYGLELANLDVLEVGPGQLLGYMACFERLNRIVGIDLDVIPQGLSPFPYFVMWRVNGLRRTIKTISRKLMGFDRLFRQEMMRELGMESWPRLKVLNMEAERMRFSCRTFDLVYSFEVFEHVLNPAAAIDEIVRVLRPRGTAYLLFQLYTGPTGALDYAGNRKAQGEPIWWRHLRPQLMDKIDFQSALNKWRLDQWRQLFSGKMPTAEITLCPVTNPEIEDYAKLLQARGELADYRPEELLTDSLIVLWRKPGDSRGR